MESGRFWFCGPSERVGGVQVSNAGRVGREDSCLAGVDATPALHYSVAVTSRSSHAREIYDAHVRSLPRDVQLQLLAVIADAAAAGPPPAGARFSELSGLGAEVWAGSDPAAYVQELRDEWSGRP